MQRRPPPPTLEARIANCSICKNGNRVLYSLPLEVLRQLPAIAWDKNREVDLGRVDEIVKTIEATNRVVGIIYLAHLNGNLVCFDGNHRRLALQKVKVQTENILVIVMWRALLQDVVDEFNNINLAVSVSSVHLDCGVPESEKAVIISYVSNLVRSHPTMASPAARCIRPHFNRDILEQDLFDLLKEHADLNTAQVVATLNQMNREYVDGRILPSRKTRADSNAKCRACGLWLFCEGRTIDRYHFDHAKKLL